MLTLSKTLSLQNVIINTYDPMQNPGQTGIIYKAGQTWLTRAKRDPVDSTRCNADPYQITEYLYIMRHNNHAVL